MKRIAFSIALLFIFIGTVQGATLYVSSSGSGSTCSIGSPCLLSYANTNASPGDTVILRGGTYALGIRPAKTGTGVGNGRIIFQAYTGETPIIAGNGAGDDSGCGIAIIGKNYIKIDGVTVGPITSYYPMQLSSASYNEITNITLFSDANGSGMISPIWGGLTGVGSTHNWLHGNTFRDVSSASGCDDGTGIIEIGIWYANEDINNNNTIENNVFYHGGHHTVQDYSHFNVIRNNILHNEGFWSPSGDCGYDPSPAGTFPDNGKFGHRNLELQAYSNGNLDGLIEKNRIAYSSANPANNGAENFTLAASRYIIRYNDIFDGSGPGLQFKSVSSTYSSNNRIYNNTITGNGRYTGTDNPASPIKHTGIDVSGYVQQSNNVIKNNIVYNHSEDIYCAFGNCSTYGVISSNNLCGSVTANGCTYGGNPLFTSVPTITTSLIESRSFTSPNFALQVGSPAINAGTYLTTAVGSGNGSTSLTVADSYYFQGGSAASSNPKGSSLSTVQADQIAVGTVSNIVRISSVNYATNVITLEAPITWSNGASIWLYSVSDGTVVLVGSAPDIGAYEYGAGGDVTAPSVTITSPTSSATYSTSSSTVTLAGTASDNVVVTAVSWVNNRGGSGTCTGTTSWSKTDITLYSGVNVITITATDGINTATDILTVTLDNTPPFIDNLSPSGVQTCTSNPRNVTMSFTTDESASAKYGTADTTYALLPNTFGTTGINHTQVVSVACGASYTYYVRTSDALGNVNTSSAVISFSVASPQIAGPGGLRIIGGRLTH
jgi:hypothetical protein